MKTLVNHVIVYDNDCPMCKLYTDAFVKTGMLDENGRQPFTEINHNIANALDHQRACDEIALVNVTDGSVTYGINSLFTILSHRLPILKPMFASPLVRWPLTKLYSFISYNRKAIAPAETFEAPGSCTPVFNIRYRVAYLIFTWILTSWILNSYSHLLMPVLPKGSFYREMLICGGQIIFQAIAVTVLRRDRLMHYLGNMMTVSLAGALLLLPVIMLAQLGVCHIYFSLAWFGLVVSAMLLEHARRVKLLAIHWSASATWVLYRILVLTIIFSL